MKQPRTLSTGAFARLCRTTKATLFHYDKLGLLKPRCVAHAGYRRYALEQFFDFDLISLLKETGSSLREIRRNLRQSDAEALLKLLQEKLRLVQDEHQRLTRRETMLHNLVDGLREAMQLPFDTFHLCQQPEEELEAVATHGTLEDAEADYVVRFAEYAQTCAQNNRPPLFPFGVIIDREAMLAGRNLEKYFFSSATAATPPELLHRKPSGLYASITHKGDAPSHLRCMAALAKHINDEALRAAGDCYCYDMMASTICDAGEGFAARYSIRVER